MLRQLWVKELFLILHERLIDKQSHLALENKFQKKGAFAGEGALTDVASGTGELGSLAFPLSQGLTYTKAAIPAAKALGSGAIETTKRVGKELLTTTPKQEFGYGTLALAGGEGVEQVFW